MRRIKVFFINTIILIITSLILKSITSVFSIYISNIVGAEAIGVFGLVMSVYMFMITLATSGLNLACTRIVSEELANNNIDNAKKAGKVCILISLFFGALAGVILFINARLIVKYFLHNKVNIYVIYTMCIALPFIAMSSSINGYFTAVRKVYKNVISQFVEQISKILFTTYIVHLFLPKGLDYICFSLILGDVISEVLSFICSYLLYLYDVKKHLSLKRNSYYFTKRILKITIPVAITSYIRSGLSTLKQIIIPSSLEKSGMECSIAFSHYGIVSGMVLPIIMFPSIIISSFSSLLIPEFSRYMAKKDFKRIREVTTYSIILTTIISLVLTIFFMIFAENINQIFYKDYDITSYLKLISPLILFIYVDIVVDSILKGLDAQVSVMFINVIDLIVTVSFIYFFVPIFGTKGYILSLYISEFLNFSFSSFKLLQLIK